MYERNKAILVNKYEYYRKKILKNIIREADRRVPNTTQLSTQYVVYRGSPYT